MVTCLFVLLIVGAVLDTVETWTIQHVEDECHRTCMPGKCKGHPQDKD